MKSEHFSRPEFEHAIAKCLTYGDESKIAPKCDVSIGHLSRYLNGDDERESPLFKAACIVTAWIDTNCQDGQKALAVLNSYISRALPCDENIDLEEARREDIEEEAQFRIKEIEHVRLEDQIEEGERALGKLQRHVNALKGELQRYQQREMFPGQLVSHGPRSVGQRAVNAARNGR